jgi:hypothetical protein
VWDVGSTLLAQVRQTQQRVVNSIGEVGDGCRRREFDDLLVIEEALQFAEVFVPNGGGAARHLFGKVDDRLVFLVEQVATVIEAKRLYLLRGDTDPLRRSGMGSRSILTAVEQ